MECPLIEVPLYYSCEGLKLIIIRLFKKYLFLNSRNVLSPRSEISEQNFFKAAALPFSTAYLPLSVRVLSEKAVNGLRFLEVLVGRSSSFRTASFASSVATTPIPVSVGEGSVEDGLK